MTTACSLALRHFDSLYAQAFGRSWPSARLGLLSPKKYCLISNSFLDSKSQEAVINQHKEALNLRRYYNKHLLSYHRSMKNSEQPIEKPTGDVKEEQVETTDYLSSAEDLMQMFSDRRVDDDEKYFINKASTHLSLNDFVPATELISKERLVSDSTYYQAYDPDLELDIDTVEEPPLQLSEQLNILTFPRNNWSRFEEPNLTDKASLFDYYLLDGGSILPVLALDVQLDDECADYCAAPGGRMYEVFRRYLPDIGYTRDTLRLSNKDARMLVQPDAFDKILVDVPCSNDRISAEQDDNNLFRRSRTDERLALPEQQCEVLVSALKSVKPKGSVVYSTCTMSPVENDGVVQKALMKLQMESYKARFAVVSLKEAFRPMRGLYKFYTKHKYGQLVMPNITSNFGPMYISKIKRLS